MQRRDPYEYAGVVGELLKKQNGISVDQNAIHDLLVELEEIWDTFEIEWRRKREGLGEERPRGYNQAEHPSLMWLWQATHFGRGEFSAIEKDGRISATPLKRFLPLIDKFVDDHDFPKYKGLRPWQFKKFNREGKPFDWDEDHPEKVLTEMQVHKKFAVWVSRYFYDGFNPNNWQSADREYRARNKGSKTARKHRKS